MKSMSIKYYLQKWLGEWLDSPVIPAGKIVGYSLVRSEKSNTDMGRFTKVYPPLFLHNVQIGDYSYVAGNSRIRNAEIGKFCSIGPNFCCGLGFHPVNGISTAPMFFSQAKQNGITLSSEDKVSESVHAIIGNDVFIGANVTVLDGVRIADGAVIGAGAVVVEDVPPYAVAVGVPARVVKYRFDEATIRALLAKQWWNGPEEELKRVERDFWDVKSFLGK